MAENQNSQTPKDISRLLFERQERLKELSCINQTTAIIKEGKTIKETLLQIAMILPNAWQYPEFAVARIKFDGNEFTSADFETTKWLQSERFSTIDQKTGIIEVYYTQEFVHCDEGPFLQEERQLLMNLSGLITGYLNSIAAKNVLSATEEKSKETLDAISPVASHISGRKLLQHFLNRSNYARDIYHDLMPFKVKEILLVANLYDAFIIEREGRFSEHVLGEYSQLNLSTVPRITGVSNEEEVFDQLQHKHFDLIIFMMGVDKQFPVVLSKKIKSKYPYIPVFVLLNNNSDLLLFEEKGNLQGIDKLFVWNGDSRVFFAMIKHVEDKINAENDTRVGMTRVILLVEDNPIYFSRYIPVLYNIVLEQTRRIIDDVSTDELYKILRLRARPKILLASSFEEAVDIFQKFKDYMLCLITDVKFPRDGELNETAGFDLLQLIRSEIKELPCIIQSSDTENAKRAHELRAAFVDKRSDNLILDFKDFLAHYLGFGDFTYRDKHGVHIATAKSLKEFENNLKTIPDESLIYHGKKNHFSLWLMARGEIQAAKIINPLKVSDFQTPAELRQYLIDVIKFFRNEQNRGKVIPFEESLIHDDTNILALSEGALGGKGRGLAFINTLIYNFDFEKTLPNINLKTPKTSIIGADEFEVFMERNKLYPYVFDNTPYEELKKIFVSGKLSENLLKKLRPLVKNLKKPLAIRSSGLFEDSLLQPFAGVFSTYLLPNNHPDFNVRLEQCMDAIKLVYVSVFSPEARGYIEAVNYKIEEEKMAVVIQEVVGNQFDNVFYPHISGVAQSYNYYPFGHMQPDEGFVVCAVGLGQYVVEGEKAYRFSPKYPLLENSSPKDIFRNSQVHFYAVNLENNQPNLLVGEDAGLIKLDISTAGQHGTIKHCASVYDFENQRIVPGLSQPGPMVINFADILKYQFIPLTETIQNILEIGKEALGSPVEIEFAVDLNRDSDYKATFHLLQIKPLIGSALDYTIDMDAIKNESILLFTNKAMGNGLIDSLEDVVYIDRNAFDKSKTKEMVAEIEMLNAEMIKQNRKYVLIGPGRWGTRDPWIGIPITWSQISNAKIIVETSFDDFPLDGSSGSHFFHNVTSMNVGYFTVQQEMPDQFIKWEVLDSQPLINSTNFFRHVRFAKPMTVKMDGRKRISLICLEC